MGTSGNSSAMYCTRRDVEVGVLVDDARGASVADKNVSGTKIKDGLCK
jgi:hypothetical protein